MFQQPGFKVPGAAEKMARFPTLECLSLPPARLHPVQECLLLATTCTTGFWVGHLLRFQPGSNLHLLLMQFVLLVPTTFNAWIQFFFEAQQASDTNIFLPCDTISNKGSFCRHGFPQECLQIGRGFLLFRVRRFDTPRQQLTSPNIWKQAELVA